MAKFRQKGNSQGGGSKSEKKKSFGTSKPKIIGKKKNTPKKSKKFVSNKSKGQLKKPNNDVDKSVSEIKSVGQKRKLPSTPDNNSSSDTKKEKSSADDGIKELMVIYEQLRRKNTSKEDKHKLIEKVLQYSNDTKNQIVFKHDAVRVLEHCVKYGDSKQRECLFELFKENTVHLVSFEYSKHLVKKFMEYGTKEQKAKIISSFYGKVRKLIKQKFAADILEEIYAKYANSVQRILLSEDFYGSEFAVFKVATGQSFEYMIENEPDKKESVLEFLKTQFITLCQKGLILHSITHKALLDFFKYADNTQKLEVHEVLKEQILNILHTKDGAKVSMNCLWLGTRKDRKSILKSFKTFVVKICKEEFGHLVMLALFDVVDDTVLIKKALFPEIVSNLEDLIANQYGRKVILYLLKPRSHSYFLPDIIKILEQGDNNVYSKKPQEVRQDELRACILPDLLKAMIPHLTDIMKNKSVAIVLLAALECSSDSPELISVFESIASIISEPLKKLPTDGNITEEIDSTESAPDHPVCDACGHWVIKNIIQQDKTRKENNNTTTFSQILCNSISPSCFTDWATCNRGAFVLISLLETGIDSVKKMVVENLTLPASSQDDRNKGIHILQELLNK